jgi:hypothetical protein
MVRNEDLLHELNASHEQDRMTDGLAALLLEMATRLSHHRYFIRYSTREEMVAAGLLVTVTAWRHFDLNYPNPHAYFSKVLYRAFRAFQMDDYKERIMKSLLAADAPPLTHSGDEEEQEDILTIATVGEGTALRQQLSDQMKKCGALELRRRDDKGRQGRNVSQPASFVFEVTPDHLNLPLHQLNKLIAHRLRPMNIRPLTVTLRYNGTDLVRPYPLTDAK